MYNGQYIEGANSDIHYPQEVGLYQVYIEDVYGCSDYSDEVFLPEVGLNEFDEHDFKIYPNPSNSSNYLNISQINSIGSIIITNILGQEYNRSSIDSQSSNIDYSINISEWPNGLYFIILENNSYNIVKRFVKN